jgi:hypothetical protein
MNTQYKQAKSPTNPQRPKFQLITCEINRSIKQIPRSLSPKDKYLIIRQRQYNKQSQRNIGKEIFPPRLRNIEDNHRYYINIINNYEKYTTLKPHRKTFILYIAYLSIRHPSICAIVNWIYLSVYRNPRDLSNYLKEKYDHHLSDVGETK